jgi:SHS2 domain-containing protein
VYRFVDHTAELELEIEATSEGAVFADALAALAELLEDATGGERERHEVELEDVDRAGLLAGWLDELVYLADVEGFVPERVVELELEGARLRATLEGHRGDPSPLVKAVTRHRLAFAVDAAGMWRARLVLDV